MIKTMQIPEIGAEMLLNYLYPELEEQWTARHHGTFYRNYSRDVLELDPEKASVRLSRDSILGLLPQGLFSQEGDLKKGDRIEKHKELEQQMKLLSEAFLPFDTFAFRRQLRLERSVSELLNQKLEYLLSTYFGINLEAIDNPYVREVAVLLPVVSRCRGDMGLVRNLLEGLFHCRVTMEEKRYSQLDNTRCWLPQVRYELLIPGLSPQDYVSLRQQAQPLAGFLEEWFMPMEVRLDIVVREHGLALKAGAPMTLDYNTEM